MRGPQLPPSHCSGLGGTGVRAQASPAGERPLCCVRPYGGADFELGVELGKGWVSRTMREQAAGHLPGHLSGARNLAS